MESTNKLLGSRVQMKSMEVVLLPMARQVSELTLMYHAAGHLHPPSHTMRARAVADTMENLIMVAKQVAMESSDKILQSNMFTACNSASDVGNKLLTVTRSISAKPSQETTVELLDTANAILQATMNILMIWDETEVRRIVDAGQWFLDRLALVEGAQSQRGLVICFKGLSDALLHLLALVDKRLKELIYQDPREQLATCLMSLKGAIPKLSSSMQAFIQDKKNEEKRLQKSAVIQDIRDTIHNLLVAVSGSCAVGERAPSEGMNGSEREREEDLEREALFDFDEDNMASQMEKVQYQLSGIQRYSLDEDFNQYIDAIIRNSMAVAQVSKDSLRDIITGLCHQVIAQHQQLLTVFQDMCQNPTSKELKKAFDDTADLLSEKLIELDVAVGDSVIDQAANVVVNASAPVERLVEVASATMLHSPSGSSVNLDQEIQDFKRHSRQLTQVAIYAAESAPDTKSMKDLRSVAAQIEHLTPQVVSASRVVNRDPDDPAALRKMEELKREWGDAVSLLTKLLDTVTDPRDYIMAAETHIKEDIIKCRDSKRARDPTKLSNAINSLSSRVKRAAHVASNEALHSPDPNYKEPLLTAASQLDKDADNMSSEGSKLLQNIDDRAQGKKFARSVNDVHDSVQDVKSIMFSQPNVSMKEPASTSTPISVPTYQGGIRPSSGKRIVSSLATATYTAGEQDGRLKTADSVKPAPVRNISPSSKTARQPVELRPQIPIIQEQTGRELMAKMDVKPQMRGRPIQEGDFPDDIVSRDPHVQQMPAKIVSERGIQEEREEQADGTASQLTRNPSYGEYDRGFSQSYTTGEVETQTPLARKRDSEIQTFPDKEKWERKATAEAKFVAVESKDTRPPKDESVTKVTKSTSTSNLYGYTHSETSLQTGTDLWDMDSIVDLSSPYAVYTLPIQRLISAAVTGNLESVGKAQDVVSDRFEKLLALTTPLEVGLVGNPELLSSLREASDTVGQLTKVVIDCSEDVADNPQKLPSLDDLRQSGKDLVRGVHKFANVLDKSCLPWSQCAQRIIGSTANKRQMEAEISQLKNLVDQMMNVAKVTIEVGSVKMATQSSFLDNTCQDAIERIIQLCGEVQSLTSEFTAQTQSYQQRSRHTPTMSEELQVCAAQWAATVKAFLFQLDCVTVPTGSPVEALILAGETGDRELLSKQTTYIKSLSSSLFDISKNATEDTKEESLVQLLRSTSSSVEKLAAKLTDTAELLTDTRSQMESVQYQRSAENAEILQREWAAKVLLVQVHIDDLTDHHGVVLDQMMRTALQANSLDNEQDRDKCMGDLAAQTALLEENLSKLEDAFVHLVRGLPKSLEIKAVSSSVDFLRKLNPYIIKSAKGLAKEKSSGIFEHFYHLRRQWSARALYLGANLNKILVVDMTIVNAIFEALINGREIPENVCVVAGADSDIPVGGEESIGSLSNTRDMDSEGSLPRIIEEDFNPDTSKPTSTKKGRFSWEFSDEGDVLVTSEIVENDSSSRRESEESLEYDVWEEEQKSLEDVEEEVLPANYEEEPELTHVRKTARSTTLPDGIEMRYISNPDKPRPVTIAGLPNWKAGVDINPTSNSIAAAALSLHETVYSFEEGENPLLSIAKGMSEQMFQIAQYCRGRGDLKTQDDMIEAARSVASDGQKIAKFVSMIAKHCTDTNMQANLQHYAEVIPTTSKQLSIIAKVKAATPSDKSAELMLGKNAENLMKVVIESIKAAEAACVKGLRVPDDDEEKEAVELILLWKRRLDQHRYLETLYAPRTTRGLREVGKVKSDPSLANLVKSDIKFGRSP